MIRALTKHCLRQRSYDTTYRFKRYREAVYKTELLQLKDPLNLMINMHQKDRAKEIFYQLEISQGYVPNLVNIGSLMYHMGKHNTPSKYIIDRIENKLIEF